MGRLVVRGGGDWLRWVQELADWCRVPVATVTDQALRRYAEAVGWNRRGPARVARRRDLGARERVRVEHDHFHGTGAFRPDGTADCPPLPGGPDG